MRVLFVILGIIIGAGLAFLLNKQFTKKLVKKEHRLTLQITTYIICIVLCSLFMFCGSLRIILDNFADSQIVYLEQKLNSLLPEQNLLDTNVDAEKIAEAMAEVQSIIDGDTADGIFQKMIIRSLTNNLSKYVNMAGSSANELTQLADSDGNVTVKTILSFLKTQALNTVEPIFNFLQILIVIILVIYIGAYYAVSIFLNKSVEEEKDSIVFGEAGASNSWKLPKSSDDSPKNESITFGDN
ncbi:MAG: hypothetical protein LBU88_06725 [Treponema sp.]|jgi:TRAP-type C4-dicarboxylate transport system permease small subunit|nr:hypothetical protein [Treponema sp.]